MQYDLVVEAREAREQLRGCVKPDFTGVAVSRNVPPKKVSRS